jgi:hypothetical protein
MRCVQLIRRQLRACAIRARLRAGEVVAMHAGVGAQCIRGRRHCRPVGAHHARTCECARPGGRRNGGVTTVRFG